MKPDNDHDPVSSNRPQLEPFYFEFSHPTARAVRIAGTFNGWQPEAEPMDSMGDGFWLKKTILPPGTHEYCLVVDGQWTPDPLVRETVTNPFGGKNSVLKVTSQTRAARRLEAEHLQPKTANP